MTIPDFSLDSLLSAYIAQKLSPALFDVAGGDTERAEAEMLQAVADYRPRNRRDVVAAGQIIIYGLAGITTAGASLAADITPADARDLRRSALGFNRAAEQNRPVLRLQVEAAPPRAFSDADQRYEDEMLLSAEAAAVLAAEAEARLRTPATDARSRTQSPAAEAALWLPEAEEPTAALTPKAEASTWQTAETEAFSPPAETQDSAWPWAEALTPSAERQGSTRPPAETAIGAFTPTAETQANPRPPAETAIKAFTPSTETPASAWPPAETAIGAFNATAETQAGVLPTTQASPPSPMTKSATSTTAATPPPAASPRPLPVQPSARHTAQPVPNGATAAAPSKPDDSNQRLEAMWAIAMMKEADFLRANITSLPPAERREVSIKVGALSSAAQSLLTEHDPIPLPAAFRLDKRKRPFGS